jgi:hypothetical protein
MVAGKVEPLNLETVESLLESHKLSRQAPASGSWPKIDQEWVREVLMLLDQNTGGQAPAFYIAGGKLYRLDSSGAVKSEDSPQAQPYLWPIGHDVRPASQALGANGCQDCHSKSSPVFFGLVEVDSPLEQDVAWKMNRFQPRIDAAYQAKLAYSWRFRNWLKALASGAAILLLLLLLGGVFQVMARMSKHIARGR